MASSHVTSSVDAHDGFARPATLAATGMPHRVGCEVGIDFLQSLEVGRGVVVVLGLVGVDPEVDIPWELSSKAFDRGQSFLESDDTDAAARA
ncbi:MAG: hypothetical protein AAF517_03510 [Planctomycetota bacterium]